MVRRSRRRWNRRRGNRGRRWNRRRKRNSRWRRRNRRRIRRRSRSRPDLSQRTTSGQLPERLEAPAAPHCRSRTSRMMKRPPRKMVLFIILI